MMSDIEIIDMFKSKGIKATPQRVVVYKALMELKHPCAEEVIEQVRSKTPLVSVATVYNVLEFFFKSGLINKVLTGDNRMLMYTNTIIYIALISMRLLIIMMKSFRILFENIFKIKKYLDLN